MIVIKPDHHRHIDIPGVPAPVRRPVDIDPAKTGFTRLRTLRIYQFDQGSVIEGHAEEDEVFIVVLAGSVELTVNDGNANLDFSTTLSAPKGANRLACVAYLPPGAAYKLIPHTGADVAYARATPSGLRPAKFFSSLATETAPGISVLLEETSHAERLRLRLLQFDATQHDISFTPIDESGAGCEALVHIRIDGAEQLAVVNRSPAQSAWLESWDTLAMTPNEGLTLNIAKGSSGLVLIVMAA
jgi:hypothetical protein